MIDILIYIAIGAVAGWLAGFLMGYKGSLLRDIILGIIGGFVGGYVFSLLGIDFGVWGTILVPLVGACIVIFVFRLLFK